MWLEIEIRQEIDSRYGYANKHKPRTCRFYYYYNIATAAFFYTYLDIYIVGYVYSGHAGVHEII